MFAETRWSRVRPWTPIRCPRPPPSVSPATPVVSKVPPGITPPLPPVSVAPVPIQVKFPSTTLVGPISSRHDGWTCTWTSLQQGEVNHDRTPKKSGTLLSVDLPANPTRCAQLDRSPARSADALAPRLTGDHRSNQLIPTPVDPLEPGGRGLVLVDRLSEEWGVITRRDTKRVWATLRCS